MKLPGAVAVVVMALALTACATTGRTKTGAAVPRPFPGAALPPTAPEPVAAEPVQPAPPGEPAAPVPDIASIPATPIIATALALRGTPYRNGGSDPSGFDCSGFVQWVFAQNGRPLPREVREQYGIGRRINLDRVQPGDLVFFQTVSNGPSHVGIVLGGDQFVHAPSSRGVVRVERYTSEYWSKRFVGARRVTADDGTKTD